MSLQSRGPDVQVRPRRDRDRNRAALVRAACTVFAERGVAAPLESVSNEADLSIATLYRHFKTRELLLDEVYARALASYIAAIRLLDRSDPWAAFVAHTHWAFEASCTDLTLVRALVARTGSSGRALIEAQQIALEALDDLLANAKAQGRFRHDRSREDVLLYLTANEALVLSDDNTRSDSQRLLALMVDSVTATRGTAKSD